MHREVKGENGRFRAKILANNNKYGLFKVTNPLMEAEDAVLAWYFEEWLRFPFIGEVRAREAAAIVQVYGKVLFDQSIP